MLSCQVCLLALQVFTCTLLTSMNNGLKLCRKCISLFLVSHIENTSTRSAPAQFLKMLTPSMEAETAF